jgi:hypothetical protein
MNKIRSFLSNTNHITIYRLTELKSNIKKYGIEHIIGLHLKEKKIKVKEDLDIKYPYLYCLKKKSEKIDKNNLIQDLKFGLPDFNSFTSLDFLN